MLNLDFNDMEASLWTILILAACFLAVFFYCYRQRIISIFDPLVILAVSQAAYSLMAVVVISSPFLLFQFIASQAAFVFGFLLIPAPRLRPGVMIWTNRDILIAECTVFLLFLLIFFSNAWLGVVAGFPIFSNDPSASKVSVYMGGLGLVRRINWGVGILVPAGALLLAIRGKHKVFFGVMFGACVLLASLNGSKGALFVYLNIIGYVLYRQDLISSQIAKRLRRISIVLVIAAVFLAITVLYVFLHDWRLAAIGILHRILLEGDGIIYYYDPRVFPHFASYGPLDFLYMVLNPVLGGLRLVPYQNPVGFEMVQYYLGNSNISEFVLGPNTPFFLAGHIYFGSFFGVIYCGAVGYFLARVRSWFLKAQGISPLRLIWFLTLALLVFNLPGEVNLFTSPLFDTSVLLLLAIVFVRASLFILRHATGRPEGRLPSRI